MSKAKLGKGEANKTLRARTEYLHRAARYIHNSSHRLVAEHARTDELEATGGDGTEAVKDDKGDGGIGPLDQPVAAGPSGTQRHLTSHLRGVSQRSQIRLARDVKRSLCKRCDVYLDGETTSVQVEENKSRGGRKPWAKVSVHTCKSCGTSKRFPIGAKRQPMKATRKQGKSNVEQDVAWKPQSAES